MVPPAPVPEVRLAAMTALPQPAKMVSLPAIEDLPSKQEIVARDKAAKADMTPRAAARARATFCSER